MIFIYILSLLGVYMYMVKNDFVDARTLHLGKLTMSLIEDRLNEWPHLKDCTLKTALILVYLKDFISPSSSLQCLVSMAFGLKTEQLINLWKSILI